jgi:hypothetical protein
MLRTEVSPSVLLHHTCFLCRRNPVEMSLFFGQSSLCIEVRIRCAQPHSRGFSDSFLTFS